MAQGVLMLSKGGKIREYGCTPSQAISGYEYSMGFQMFK